MIANLSGEILFIDDSSLTVSVGGIGFKVFVPKILLNSKNLGDHISLSTYLVVRENELSLYGFETPEEKQFFTMLLGVDGIGPKVALSILSTMTIDSIQHAINSDQPDLLSKVPGVGKKTAQKIQLYLKDKVAKGNLSITGMAFSEHDADLLAALTTLGYSVVESQRAIQSLPKDQDLSLEDKIRTCLSFFQ
jgi:Holliday junction DNA helicase RuvA